METSSLRPAVATITVATSQRTRGIIRQPFCYRATGGDGVVADQLRGSGVRAKGAGTPPCGRADSARSASHSGRHRAVPGPSKPHRLSAHVGARGHHGQLLTASTDCAASPLRRPEHADNPSCSRTTRRQTHSPAPPCCWCHRVVQVVARAVEHDLPDRHGSAASAPAKSSS